MKSKYLSRKFILTLTGMFLFASLCVAYLIVGKELDILQIGGIIAAMMTQYNFANAFNKNGE